MRIPTPRVALTLGLAAIVGGVAARHRTRHFDRTVNRRVGELIAGTEPQTDVVTAADIDAVPSPIRRYFERVLDVGQPLVRRARIQQRGEFRFGVDWHPLTATEWVSTRPPGFLWDASVDVFPLVPVRVIDRYQDGEGVLDARLHSLVQVAQAGPTPAMNEGELLRYLAEGVWYPTALLPSQGIEWESVNASAARATLEDGDTTASAVFHVGDDDTVERVTAKRYRQEDDDYQPWVGHFGDYARQDGLLVPTSGTVAWQLLGEEQPYWRGTIENVEYTTARE